MTASFNISNFVSSASATSQVEKKDYRSTAYNNYQDDVIDFDNEVFTLEIEAENFAKASEQAESIAHDMGIQVSYLNIYKQ